MFVLMFNSLKLYQLFQWQRFPSVVLDDFDHCFISFVLPVFSSSSTFLHCLFEELFVNYLILIKFWLLLRILLRNSCFELQLIHCDVNVYSLIQYILNKNKYPKYVIQLVFFQSRLLSWSINSKIWESEFLWECLFSFPTHIEQK